MRLTPSIPAVLALCLAALPGQSHAGKSFDSCTGFVTSLPATLTTQGKWCLTSDLSTSITSGPAILIANNNITLDCNDFVLDGLAGGVATTANGVLAVGRMNATVRNCNIRGFHHGAILNGGGGHIVEDSVFHNNRFAAIRVVGDGSTIRRNRAHSTGFSQAGTPAAYGIYTLGSMDILDNVVNQVEPYSLTQTANGIYTDQNHGGTIRGNFIRGLFAQETDNMYAISAPNSNRVMIQGNIAQQAFTPGGTGILCSSSAGSARGNVTTGFADGVVACTSASNLHIGL